MKLNLPTRRRWVWLLAYFFDPTSLNSPINFLDVVKIQKNWKNEFTYRLLLIWSRWTWIFLYFWIQLPCSFPITWKIMWHIDFYQFARHREPVSTYFFHPAHRRHRPFLRMVSNFTHVICLRLKIGVSGANISRVL